MMTTKFRSKADAPLPIALTTPFLSHINNNGVRPRIRRRIPSIQPAPTAIKPLNAATKKKPGSAGSTRSNASVKSSRSAASVKSSSSTSDRSATSAIQNGDLNDMIDYDDDSDVRFINVPSLRETEDVPTRVPPKQLRDIAPEEILSQAQETEASRVYQIDLHGAHIGRISNLEKFTRVRVLDISCNHINCIENIHNSTELRELKLYDNAISEIQNLEKLKANLCNKSGFLLYLVSFLDYKITNLFRTLLCSLQGLCHLQLQHNRIRALGRGLNQLRKLQVLRLDSNCIFKIDSRELTSCASLTSIDLSNNRLDNLTALSCLPNLEELHAINNRLRSVADLSRCKKLQEVDLSYNRITDVSGLKGLPNLSYLHLAYNQLVNMKSLGKVKNMEELNLTGNRLNEASHLVTFYPALQLLDISENHIETWEQVVSLSRLPELVELYVAGNPFCRENGIKPVYHGDLQKEIPRLEILDGAHVKRQASRTTTPLMRPMSAATVVTARQVENQLQGMESEIIDFETSLSSKFDSLKSDMRSLPVEPPSSRPVSGLSEQLGTPASSRPGSKSGKRSRFQEAKAFAENHFDEA